MHKLAKLSKFTVPINRTISINLFTGHVFNPEEARILRRNGETYYKIYGLAYAANAYFAFRATENSFNYCAAKFPFCKGNAFKHALFRVYDAETFGFDIAKDLGNAHESNQGSGTRR